jgi:hypothetical protein
MDRLSLPTDVDCLIIVGRASSPNGIRNEVSMPNTNKIVLQIGNKYGFEFQGKSNDLALFAILGNTLAAVQSFEMNIAVHLDLLSEKRRLNRQNRNDDLDRFYSLTLGALIKQFQKHLPDSGIATLLENVREKRNYLIHRILREYQWPIMNDEDYVRAIKEMDQIRELMEKANVEVSRYLADHSLANLIVFSIDNDSGEITQIV